MLRRIKRHQDDAATMALSAALLEQNPECYTVWTFRRRVLSEQMLVSWHLLFLVLARPAAGISAQMIEHAVCNQYCLVCHHTGQA